MGLKDLIVFVWTVFAMAAPVFGQEFHVVDGDKLRRGDRVYRIAGIDAPEYAQKCARAGKGTWPCGKAAAEKLEALVAGGAVTCMERESDEFGRRIADCHAGDINLGATMVRTGHAWAYVKYSNAYRAEETAARQEKLGIWQADSQPAWDYRAARWEVAEQAAPKGCPIKGNISQNGRIYHTPWSPWYKATKINKAKGERWFCNEAEALAAGWRAPYRYGRR